MQNPTEIKPVYYRRPHYDTEHVYNCLAVIDSSHSILYLGTYAECYNYMLNYPHKWDDILYAFRSRDRIKTYGPAPIKLAELQFQYRAKHNPA